MVRFTVARRLMSRSLASIAVASSSSTRSSLFRMMRSASATCCRHSFTASSGFSSSRCSITCLLSTTVTRPSSRARFASISSTKNVLMMGDGFARPVVSMTTWSMLFRRGGAHSSNSMLIKSERTVQHKQPLLSMMTVSPPSILVLSVISSLSMSIAPNSFSITAMRLPSLFFSRLFKSVVFPLPRYPVMTVQGRRGSYDGSNRFVSSATACARAGR
mmetsp:Transcript_963/g.2109  ORF Transcript_963/g.2109 Transcript_963/m.2109 type:complete len:217 (+) Transcript_963:601-1251(+)